MMEYYDANRVAGESAEARYTVKEEPVLCDCGAEAENGQVYCNHCTSWAMEALSTAQAILKKHTGMNMDLSTDLLVYVIEHEDEIKEHMANERINRNTMGA